MSRPWVVVSRPLVCVLSLCGGWGAAMAATTQNFNAPGTAYVASACSAVAAPVILAGGPGGTGNFMRLVRAGDASGRNSVAFAVQRPRRLHHHHRAVRLPDHAGLADQQGRRPRLHPAQHRGQRRERRHLPGRRGGERARRHRGRLRRLPERPRRPERQRGLDQLQQRPARAVQRRCGQPGQRPVDPRPHRGAAGRRTVQRERLPHAAGRGRGGDRLELRGGRAGPLREPRLLRGPHRRSIRAPRCDKRVGHVRRRPGGGRSVGAAREPAGHPDPLGDAAQPEDPVLGPGVGRHRHQPAPAQPGRHRRRHAAPGARAFLRRPHPGRPGARDDLRRSRRLRTASGWRPPSPTTTPATPSPATRR